MFGVSLAPMPSGFPWEKKRDASVFGWLTLKGNPSPRKLKKGGNPVGNSVGQRKLQGMVRRGHPLILCWEPASNLALSEVDPTWVRFLRVVGVFGTLRISCTTVPIVEGNKW